MKTYFLGLDIGSNSVGYAVTNESYEVQKFGNKAMWGSHTFEEGLQAADRRTFRSARRRLNRKKQRIQLARELFAKEIAKIDKDFYKRLDESALLRKEKTHDSQYALFNDKILTDKEYYIKFPTIHHLIMHLINSKKKEDIRLVYLATAYMLAHRGHFLIEVDEKNISEVASFATVYESFLNYFIENEIIHSWRIEIQKDLEEVLQEKTGLREKQKRIRDLVFQGSLKPEKWEGEIIKAMVGSRFKVSVLLDNLSYENLEFDNISFSDGDIEEKFVTFTNELTENELCLLLNLRRIYDWSLLSDILKGELYLSQGKVNTYQDHKKDLKTLKYFIKKYLKDRYNEVFKFSKKGLDNYVAYSGNFKSASNIDKSNKDGHTPKLDFYRTGDNEDFLKYLRKIFKDVVVAKEDEKEFLDFKQRIEIRNAFMPKQVNTDNGVIPYQLYKYQLKKLLTNVAKHYPFLRERNEEGLTIINKLISILEFRIPYYVGPLNNYHGKFSWIERKAEGKIFPWNFEDKVDLDKSEEAFIKRMTNKCTYLAGEDVLCKNSLLYSKFMVLNEINNIKIDEKPISVECKQKLFADLFLNNKRKVTKKRIKNWLISNNYMEEFQEVRGIDDDIRASLNSYHKFRRLLVQGILTQSQIEEIIIRISIISDKKRLGKYLKENYSWISNEDRKYLLTLSFKDYGRLSSKFLTEITSYIPEAGEELNIINGLWHTNNNLMELLSKRFDYVEKINKLNEAFYALNPSGINEILDDLYVSNAVKRPIYRTLAIVKEIKGIMKESPKKIFIEMSRWTGKKERTKSRKDTLMEYYNSLDKEYRKKWVDILKGEAEDKLKSEKYFLYYMQLGKCMYTGEEIHLDQLMTKNYDIDHIYPQSKVKDDSIHNNKVLVDSNANRLKGDKIPLNPYIQEKMTGFWSMLANKELITKEKFHRLTRKTSFTDEELAGFINRQLVETQQSTKAIARLLKDIFPDTEIIYVKAGLVSEFRHQFNMLKSRDVNDLHHAKDAYLNIVIGNVYNVKFTKNPLQFIKSRDKYSVNIKDKNGLLSKDIKRNGEVAWKGDGSTIALVKRTMLKNNINYVRYPICKKGGLFNQQPEKAPLQENDLVPRKKNLPAETYGGYNNTTACFFTLVIHEKKGKKVVSILPVDLIIAKNFLEDKGFAEKYCVDKYGVVNPKIVSERKMIKINTLLSLDGFRANIASKINKGRAIVLASAVPLIVSPENEEYIRRLSSVIEKAKRDVVDLRTNSKYDKITSEKNLELYISFMEKSKANIFFKQSAFSKAGSTLEVGVEKFKRLSIEDQAKFLLNIVKLFKTGRRTGCDLKLVGGPGEGGIITLNSEISATKFKSIEIIDQSPTGLFEKRSGNLLEL